MKRNIILILIKERENSMKYVVFDCDNTFGVKGCDVDDGLTLLYLIGCEEAKLLGVTTTYGNNQIDVVYPNTLKMLKEIGREDIICKKGGGKAGEYQSEAVDFLVEMADTYPGELSVLATGSLTNLHGAYEKDPAFFEKVKEIVLMGGITAPLIFEKKQMNELNFSCDAQATHTVLTKGHKVSVITGNNCLKVLFTRAEYKERLLNKTENIAAFIREKTDYWFDDNEEDYGIQGFYNWDVTAGVYLMNPKLFTDKEYRMNISEADLQSGFLRETADKGNCILNLPQIGAEEPFKENIYSTWLKVEI